MTTTNTPGGIFGAIAKVIIDSGDASDETKQFYENEVRKWEEAGLKKGDWAVKLDDGRIVKEGSEEHRQAIRVQMSRFSTKKGGER